METNEQIKSVLRKTLEDELEQSLEQVSELAEGDWEQLEEQAKQRPLRGMGCKRCSLIEYEEQSDGS